MTRDQKIGLALGIVLVGAVAAFFYRHEEPAVDALPELKTAAELDEQISERPLAPYVEPRPTPEITTDAAGESMPIADAGRDKLVPAPISLDPMTDESARPVSLARPADSRQLQGPTGERRHIVKRGETLSSIAADFLGSPNRFQEIFEANRDQLRDANDLRPGQELRIPPRNPSVATEPTGEQQHGSFQPVTTPSPRFVPYRGSRNETQTATPSDASPASAAGRRLSQMPPKEDVIIRR